MKRWRYRGHPQPVPADALDVLLHLNSMLTRAQRQGVVLPVPRYLLAQQLAVLNGQAMGARE